MNGAHIKHGSLVAAGAVVLENQVIGPLELAAGLPARVRKQLPESMPGTIRHDADIYIDLAWHHGKIAF